MICDTNFTVSGDELLNTGKTYLKRQDKRINWILTHISIYWSRLVALNHFYEMYNYYFTMVVFLNMWFLNYNHSKTSYYTEF